MATKKDFSTDAASVFVEKMTAPAKKPAAAARTSTTAPTPKNSRQRTNADGTEVKVTFMLGRDVEAKLRYICFAERFKQKDVINAALRAYIENYESTNGKI